MSKHAELPALRSGTAYIRNVFEQRFDEKNLSRLTVKDVVKIACLSNKQSVSKNQIQICHTLLLH